MNAITISKTLQDSGLNTVSEHNGKLATRRDLYALGLVVSAGFGYLINSINNNYNLLNSIIDRVS
jgi:hypothetical protein